MSGKDFLYRFNLDGKTGVTYHGIYLKAVMSTPKSKLLVAAVISEPSLKLLYHKVLKGVSVFGSATEKFTSV